MFSGGLDSCIAIHLLKKQGLNVLALHFVLPFASGVGIEHKKIQEYADHLSVPLKIVEEGDEFLPMIKSPHFGYGKHANPCLDCRIHRIEKAKRIMEEEGACFIATGEVVGQRPMSQRMDCLNSIVKRANIKGLLLRPLCAKHLKSTIPEEKGWVDREKLLDFHGRSRHRQLAYAKKYGLKHQPPAGGCLLTNEATARRFDDLHSTNPDFSLNDFKLLAYGRHFRLTPTIKLVVGRDDFENQILSKLIEEKDAQLSVVDIPGPTAVLRGDFSDNDIAVAGKIVSRFSKARLMTKAPVAVKIGNSEKVVTTMPGDNKLCEKYRI